MSLEQAIKENTAAITALRDLILSENLKLTGKTENVQSTRVDTPVGSVEDTREAEPKAEPKAETAQDNQITNKEVIQAFIELAKRRRDTAAALLTQFRVGKAVDVPNSQLSEFYQAIAHELNELDKEEGAH